MPRTPLYQPRNQEKAVLNEFITDILNKQASQEEVREVQHAASDLQRCGCHLKFRVKWNHETDDGFKTFEKYLMGTILYDMPNNDIIVATKHCATILFWRVSYAPQTSEFIATEPILDPPRYY